MYGTKLFYKASLQSKEPLPSWIYFEENILQFRGVPDLNCIRTYVLRVEVSDGYDAASFFFSLTVTNSNPQAVSEIEDKVLDLQEDFEYSLPKGLFIDPDNDYLAYDAKLMLGGTETSLPEWLTFDTERKKLSGIPVSKYISYDSHGNQFYQVFDLRIIASDIALAVAHIDFKIIVKHASPKINPLGTSLQDQVDQLIRSQQIKAVSGKDFDFTFTADVFTIQGQFVEYFALIRYIESLPAGARLLQSSKITTEFQYIDQNTQFWMKFDQKNRRLYGLPGKNDIKRYEIMIEAGDSYHRCNSTFQIEIKNTPPKLIEGQEIQNHTLILGRSLFLQLPYVFTDQDDDQLLYIASIFLPQGKQQLDNSEAFWLKFDSSRNLMMGQPTSKDVAYLQADKKYYERFCIELAAKDSADQVAATSFYLIVENKGPVVQAGLVIPDLNQTLGKVLQEQLPYIFEDPDADALTYAAALVSGDKERQLDTSGLFWLQYDSSRNILTSNPGKQDIAVHADRKHYYQVFLIRIYASDAVKQNASFTFNLVVQNKYPTIRAEQKIQDLSVVLGKAIQSQLDYIFEDADGDLLTYSCFILIAGKEQQLDNSETFWLRYDANRNMLNGKPEAKDTDFYEQERKYFKVYQIVLRAQDAVQQEVRTEFSLMIYNTGPTILPGSLQRQFDNKFGDNVKVDIKFQVQFESKAFLDNESDTLTYSVTLLDNSIVPGWIGFDPMTLILSGEAPSSYLFKEVDLKIIASDGFQETFDTVRFKVHITWQYIAVFMLKFVGPAVALIGLYKYRGFLISLFFKWKYKYRFTEYAVIGKKFFKQIIIIKEDYEDAERVWKSFRRKTDAKYNMGKASQHWFTNAYTRPSDAQLFEVRRDVRALSLARCH